MYIATGPAVHKGVTIAGDNPRFHAIPRKDKIFGCCKRLQILASSHNNWMLFISDVNGWKENIHCSFAVMFPVHNAFGGRFSQQPSL
jgi:hypothetical protein